MSIMCVSYQKIEDQRIHFSVFLINRIGLVDIHSFIAGPLALFQYGLYSAFMGCFVYCVLGTAKDITLGPTAIMSLMTATFATSPVTGDATLAVVLTLMCGIVQFVMSILHVGGYTSTECGIVYLETPLTVFNIMQLIVHCFVVVSVNCVDVLIIRLWVKWCMLATVWLQMYKECVASTHTLTECLSLIYMLLFQGFWSTLSRCLS